MLLTSLVKGTTGNRVGNSFRRWRPSFAITYFLLFLFIPVGIFAQTTGAAFNLPACAGNPAIDDTPMLWRALNTSSSNVFFLSPARECYVNFVNAYTLPRAIKIVGTPGRSVLTPFTQTKSLAVVSNSDLVIEGVTFDAGASTLNGAQNTLIFVANAKRVSFVNDVFMSSAQGGTSSGNALWYWDSSGTIQGNDFSSFQNQVIVKADPGVNPSVAILNNNLHDNSTAGGNAIAISNDGGSTKIDASVLIDGNNISNISASTSSTGQDGNAVDIWLVNHTRISHNHVNTVRFSCFRSASSDDSVFNGNSCLNAGESAAYSEFTSLHNQWLDNYFEASAGSCLNLTNLDVGGQLHSAIGNHMVRCGTNGIAAEGNALVIGNVIDQAQYAILIGYGAYGTNVLVKDNLITDTSGSGITKFGVGIEYGVTSGIEVEGNKVSIAQNAIIPTSYGLPNPSASMPAALTIRNQSLTFSMLGSPANGSMVYCTDCVSGVMPMTCKAGGSGAFAKRVNHNWSCQ